MAARVWGGRLGVTSCEKPRRILLRNREKEYQLGRGGAHISRRDSSARASVIWSAYSSSPPMGTPVAMRVVRTPRGFISLARYSAVASPSTLGLVARMTSADP